MEITIKDIISAIVFYNGHADTLSEWKRGTLESKEKGQHYQPSNIKWGTEIHCLWELFVGMYGDWGTSIRSGWIEDVDGFVEMVDRILDSLEDNE